METKSPPDSWTNRVRGFHLLTSDQTNRNVWTPSHEQIKRARRAAPPWHAELAKHAAKKGPKDLPFLHRNWPWVHTRTATPAAANPVGFQPRIGDFGSSGRRSWWGTKREWKETDGSGKRGRGKERGVSVKFRSVAAPAWMAGAGVGCWKLPPLGQIVFFLFLSLFRGVGLFILLSLLTHSVPQRQFI